MRKSEDEKKTKRVNFVITPTLYDKYQKVAYMQHLSLNEVTNRVFAEYVEANQNLIEEYDKVFKKLGGI